MDRYPQLTPREAQFVKAAKQYCDEDLRPNSVEDDLKSRFRRESFDRAAQLKLNAISLPTEFGGQGADSQCYYSVLEEISRVSPSMAIVIGVTNLIEGGINSFGTSEQKSKFLRPLCDGKLLGAFSLSEPQSGSDAAGLKLSAKKTSGGYRLNGTKVWCTSAGVADLYLVFARTGEDRIKGVTSFLIPKDTPGFRVGKLEKKLGIRSSTLAELIFEDCLVPENFRLAEEGEGFKVALSQLDAGRISIGVVGLGLAAAAIELGWRGLKQESQAAIREGAQQQLAEYYAQLLSIRALAYETYRLRDKKEKFSPLSSSVKLLGSDLAMRVATDAVHFVGEAGYTLESDAQRLMRDAKALQIVEGTNQIQRLVLVKELDRVIG